MKRILALIFCLGLALTQAVHAEDKDKNKNAKRHANKQAAVAQHNANVARKQNINAQRNVQAQRNIQVQRNAQVQHRLQAQQNLNARRFERQQAKIQQGNTAAALRAQKFNRKNQKAVIANQNARIANQNARVAARNNRIVTNNNVVVRNRNSWYEARRFNWHQRHDRDWWRHHYGHTRFVIFGGGYYFWNNGYWYPAYGYDPAYSTYVYDEPIYGPNEYDPGRVISDVQVQLQREGYYGGPVDGLIGPMTRRALAAYQADHGLYVTRAIDEPTLEALGLA